MGNTACPGKKSLWISLDFTHVGPVTAEKEGPGSHLLRSFTRPGFRYLPAAIPARISPAYFSRRSRYWPATPRVHSGKLQEQAGMPVFRISLSGSLRFPYYSSAQNKPEQMGNPDLPQGRHRYP
jgi:hypothetical protein